MMNNGRELAKRPGRSSLSQPAPPPRAAGAPYRPIAPSPTLCTPAPVGVSHSSPPPIRKRSLTLLNFWPVRMGKSRRPKPATPCDDPAPPAGRRRPHDSAAAARPSKLQRPSLHLPGPVPPDDTTSVPLRPVPLSSPSFADVLYAGPAVPPALQAVSPSGDLRLTLRRYSIPLPGYTPSPGPPDPPSRSIFHSY